MPTIKIYQNSMLISSFNKVLSASLTDRLSGERTLDFSILTSQAQSITVGMRVELDGQLYNIVRVSKRITDSFSVTSVQCEHITYELNNDAYKLDSFEFSGAPAAGLRQILSGTPFSVGVVEPTNSIYCNLGGVTRRAALINLANLCGGEVEYDGYTINIRWHRGSKIPKNLMESRNVTDLSVTMDGRENTQAFDITLHKLADLSAGDEVHITFRPMNVDVTSRIVGITYNPFCRYAVHLEVGDYTPDILNNLQKTQNQASEAQKTASEAKSIAESTASSLENYTTKSEVSAELTKYVNSEEGRASITAAVSGTFVKSDDLSRYVEKTSLSAEIGAYIDTQTGTAKIVNKLEGTFAKTDDLGNYVQKTQLSTEIGSYIDTATGKAKIVSAASGTYQKKSDMSGYVTTTELNTSVAQYIDSTSGKAKIVSACSGTYAKTSDLSGYAKVSAVTSIEQSVNDVEAAITLSSSYTKNTIGTNVNALLQLVSNPNSSNIKIKADKIDIDGTLYLKSSDFLASGTTMIKGAKIQTSDLYIQQLRTTGGDYLIDYYGNILSIGGGVSGYNRNFASFDMIDMIVGTSVRIGYASTAYLGFYYESYGFTLRPASTSYTFRIGSVSNPIDEIRCGKLYVDGKQVTGSSSANNKFTSLQIGSSSYYWKIDENAILPSGTSSSYFNIGSSSYPIQKLYAKTIYLDGTDISTLISKTPKFTSLQVGGNSYYWKIDESAIVPSMSSGSYFNIGSSLYPIQKLYAKEIYLNGTKLTSGGGSATASADYAGKEVKMGGSSSYYIVANTNRELRPTNSSITSNYFYLGTASYPWHYAYIGSVSTMIGTQSGSKLGFFGTTPVARQTVSSSATVATLITALKKYGLIG